MLAFHNILFSDPLANLLLIGIFVGGFFVSNYYVIRAVAYLVKNWQSFSRKWQIILAVLPGFFLLIASTEPVHLAIPALPFGLLGGFPAIFVFTVEFGPTNVIAYKALGLGGMFLNALAVIGILTGFARRRERRLP